MLTCLVLVLAGAFAACSGDAGPPCPDNTEQWVKYELFLGRGGPSGEVVDDSSWDAFLSQQVTPRFPAGLTVLDAYGQWRNPEAVIEKERSKLLTILAPPGNEPMRLMNEVADEYKRLFSQGASLKVTSDACVEFR